MMKTDKLALMLKASRPDLVDGFACKAAIKVLSAEGDCYFKLAYINDLFAKKRIEVVLVDNAEPLLDGFKEVGLAGAATYVDGSIEVKLTPAFFKKDSQQTVLKRALRFQSLIVHELVHREQFQTKDAYGKTVRSDTELSDIEYLNDDLEIEAMAAEISHDMHVKHLLDGEQMFEISPRFKALMENARLLGETTISSLQQSMKAYA